MNGFPKWLPTLAAVMVGLLVLSYFVNSGSDGRGHEIPYNQFKQFVSDNKVVRIELRGNAVAATLKQPIVIAGGRESDRVITNIPAFGDPALLETIESKDIELVSRPASDDGGGWWRTLFWVGLLAAYLWFWSRMYRNVAGGVGGRGVGDFLSGSATATDKGTPSVKFDDVAGQDNAKREVAELVDILRQPERYTRLGAEPPHGILLMGPPGTGKTLLAKALAGEAGVPFFHISASEFIEMFVGVGASRVRKMFNEAKKRAPSIIFIDELDSVGRVRGAGLGGGHDEREQTLNQILAEMDGFEGHEAVVVLAATNRPDVLDPALLRPGRFDRHVTLELPDRAARAAIIAVHVRNKPIAPDVDLDTIAGATPGFSGADLKNLANEAAMAAARDGRDKIEMRDFDEMRDKVMMGMVRKLAIQPEERHRLAVHEAGHTTLAHFLPQADPIYKVTIIPRGRALGGTHMLPEEERHTLPEDYLKARLSVLLGGRTAERVILGDVSSGADDDIRQATQLARAMVARWGMSAEIGPIDLRQSEEHPFLGREIAQPRRFSDQTAHEVDESVRQLLTDAEALAEQVLREHRDGLERLVARLEQQETLDREEIAESLGAKSAETAGAQGAAG
jgi:cell division protease FtsH